MFWEIATIFLMLLIGAFLFTDIKTWPAAGAAMGMAAVSTVLFISVLIFLGFFFGIGNSIWLYMLATL